MTGIVNLVALLVLTVAPADSNGVLTGLDRVADYRTLFENKRIGIVTNHTALNRQGQFIVDIFKGMENVTVTALFGPEHGFLGTAQDGKKITDAVSDDGIPIYSLYGQHNKPTPEMLENVDILVFDIQDIGARFYTYIYTMAYAMEAAAENGKRFVVLDRPNPINGIDVQGNILDPAFATFVGLYPIATRHGMTIGELAAMFNGQQWLKDGVQADLVVIAMSNYTRRMWYDRTGLDFVAPSPNMTSLDAATVYPGMCLFEGTNLSEGRGTEFPFMQFGAPWVDGKQLAARLNDAALAGLRFQPTQFTPTLSKFRNQECFGVRMTITDRDRLDPFWSGVEIIRIIYGMYPEQFKWHVRHFDRLCGTDHIRNAIIEDRPLEPIRQAAQKQMQDFLRIRDRYLIYAVAETAASEKSDVTITAVSYNVMYFHGFPTDRVAMQGTPDHEVQEDIVRRVRKQIPVRIAQELAFYAPDIVSLQEARGEENVKAVADQLGMNFAFFPRSENADFPGAIITRYDILESQSRPVTDGDCPPDLFTRHWGRALLQTEIGKIAVHTAHLLPFGDRGAEVRGREITEILKSIKNDMEAGYPILLMGDLNHSQIAPEYARWVHAGLIDTWAHANAGLSGFTIPSTGPRPGREDHRIDFIWADRQLAQKLVHSRILYEGAFKTHADTPTSFALSDHIPVLSIFKSTAP